MIVTLSILASVWSTFISILLFLLVLSAVICIHELGHLYFAKRAGILCHEFSFGMGPKIWSIKKGETTYAIRAIPFGGYVSMAGEEVEAEVVKLGDQVGLIFGDDQKVKKIVLDKRDKRYPEMEVVKVERLDLTNEENLYINDYVVDEKAFYVFKKNEMQMAPKNRRFNGKSKTNRFLTAFGGPLMNFVLAFVIYLAISFSTGVANLDSTVIGEVKDNSPADGVLLAGDRVVSINGVDIDSWSGTEYSITTELETNLDGYIFEVERNGEIITLDTTIYPLLAFYGLGFAGDAINDDLIVYAPLFRNSELLAGDEILSVNGEAMSSWNDLIDYQVANQEGSSDAEDVYTLNVYREVVYDYKNANDDVLSGSVLSIEVNDWAYEISVLIAGVPEPVVYEVPMELDILVEEDDVVDENTVLASGNLDIEFLFYGEKELSAMGVSLFNSQIGISASTKFSFFGGIGKTFQLFWGAATAIFGTLGLLFTSNLVGISDLSGFVGIYSMTSEAAAYGLISLLSFVALLSVNLGILNLLPIPALDGGRIVFLGYEAVTGKKPNQKFENMLHTVVFFLLLALMIYVTYHDILRLFGLN
jgi:regulator of sigma E protease